MDSIAETGEACKERPILFSGPMVRALLEGRKTQTRRVIRWNQPDPGLNLGFSGLSAGHYFTDHPETGHVLYSRRGDGCWEPRTRPTHCPYGNPGDRLWVRETWADCNSENGPVIVYRAGGERFLMDEPDMLLDDGSMDYSKTPKCLFSMWDTDLRSGADDCRWRPSIFLPRWASRITLEVCDVRVQRLQEISGVDVLAEGVPRPVGNPDISEYWWDAARGSFSSLWEDINGPRGFGWNANPWVWAITFRRVVNG